MDVQMTDFQLQMINAVNNLCQRYVNMLGEAQRLAVRTVLEDVGQPLACNVDGYAAEYWNLALQQCNEKLLEELRDK